MPQSLAATRTIDARSPWTRLLIILGGLYLLHACYAVITQRHLYGDASWFLVRMISEAKPTNFYTSFAHEFYYSRVVAYWLTQLPTVIGIHAGLSSVWLLSLIFGATYFSHRMISLVICHLLLDRDEKHLIAFPLLGLLAGSIVSEVYIVTEIHISASFLWPIAILLFRQRPLTNLAYWIASATIVLAAFTYESWAFFAPMLLVGLIIKRITSNQAFRLPLGPALALVVCAVINWCAILFPRDPANKDGFVNGVLRIIYDSFAGPSHWHIGAMVAVLVSGCVLVLVALPQRFMTRALWWPVAFLALVVAAAPPIHFHLLGSGVDLSYAVTDRGFAGLVMQAGLLVIFLGVVLVQRTSIDSFRYIAVLLCGLCFGQVSWQLMATNSWESAARATRATIREESGPIPCEQIDAAQKRHHGPSASTVMCTWWATPFSLLENPNREIHTLLTTRSAFQAFDFANPASLPGASNGAFNYGPYLRSLQHEQNTELSGEISFGKGARGASLLRSGFSFSESSLTWTEGQTAVLHFCLPSEPAANAYRISFTVTPHLDRQHLPMSAEVRPGSGRATTWTFAPSTSGWVTRTIDISRADFDGTNCGDIRISFARTPASPAELGESADNRHLGLALFKATIDPL